MIDQPPDVGVEDEMDAIERVTLEWDAQGDRVFDLLFDSPELSLPIAKAAILYRLEPSDMNRVALDQSIDTARERFIEWRLRG